MSLTEPGIGFIGMGLVGPGLASALRSHGANLVGVATRSADSRERAEAALPGVPFLSDVEVARLADILFLTVGDEDIEPLATRLAEEGAFRPGQLVVHTFGGAGTAPLGAARRAGAVPVAIHPAMTFTGTSLDVLRLQQVPTAYTTDPLYQPLARALIGQFGGEPFLVGEDQRPGYHAALVHGANHLLTLSVQAQSMLDKAGVPEGAKVLKPLAEVALERSFEEGVSGLTGPASRGDWQTVREHLLALANHPDLASAYQHLSRATGALAGTLAEPMVVVRTKEDLLAALAADGRPVSLVMTMGALHDGHLSLVDLADRPGHMKVATIFVNPQQFGPDEDLAEYPRTEEADLRALEEAGVDLVYVPDAAEVYPRPPRVRVVPQSAAGGAAGVLEGAARPGHYEGVLQVVAKMFALIRPAVAVFGQKDAQQFVNIAHMVQDLDFPVELVEAPIVRSPQGLALSSRNEYLSDEQKEQALALSGALAAGVEAAQGGASSGQIVARAAEKLVDAPGVDVDYVALASRETFEVLSSWSPSQVTQETFENGTLSGSGGPQEAYLLVAAHVGGVRLIDNTILEVTDYD